jgi:hypothetical protein
MSTSLAPGCRRRRRNSSFAVWPRMSFRLLRILQARHLHENAVEPWRWMLGSWCRAVDTAAHDFDGLLDGAAHALVEPGFRHRQLITPSGCSAIRSCCCRRAEAPSVADRLGQLAQRGRRRARSAASGTRTCTPRAISRCRPGARRAPRAGCGARRRAAGHLGAQQVGWRSISSSTCEPPCRSRPSTTAWIGSKARGIQEGAPFLMAFASPATTGSAARARSRRTARGGRDDLAGLETKHLREQPCCRARAPSNGGPGAVQLLTGSLLERTSWIMPLDQPRARRRRSRPRYRPSSMTFETLPTMPPEVTTVSPRRTFLISS